MLRVFDGHSNTIWALSWLGEYLLSGSNDRSLRLWDSRSGVSVRLWQGHDAGITALALHGGAAWSASKDGTLRRWALTLPYQQTLALPSEPASAVITPALAQVAVGFADGALALYDRLILEPLWQKPAAHGGQITRLTVSHDGSLLASGSFDNTAKLWQIQASATGLSLRETATFSGHQDAIHALAFSPDGLRLATAGFDGQIGLFSVDASQPAVFIPAAHDSRIASVEFDASGRRLLNSGNEDRSLKLWDLSRRPPAALAFSQAKDNLLWASLSPDGRTLVSVGREQSVDVYDPLSSQPLAHLTGHENTVYRAAFAPDSGQIATVSSDRTVKLWSLEPGKALFSLALPTEDISPSPVWDFDFRCVTDQCLIAVPLVRGTLQLYRLGYEQPLTADADEQKRQQLVLWRQYQDSADQQLLTHAPHAAAQTLHEQDEIAQRFHAQFPNAPETAAFDTHRDCQQQQLQHLLTPDSPAPSAACATRLKQR